MVTPYTIAPYRVSNNTDSMCATALYICDSIEIRYLSKNEEVASLFVFSLPFPQGSANFYLAVSYMCSLYYLCSLCFASCALCFPCIMTALVISALVKFLELFVLSVLSVFHAFSYIKLAIVNQVVMNYMHTTTCYVQTAQALKQY